MSDINFIEWEVGGPTHYGRDPISGGTTKVAVLYGEVFKKIYVVQDEGEREWTAFGSDTEKKVTFGEDGDAFMLASFKLDSPTIQSFTEGSEGLRVLQEIVLAYWQGFCRGRDVGRKDKAAEIAKVLYT